MNVLAIGAHFDDVELGCGGTLMRLKDEGHNIFIYVATTSGFKAIKDSSFIRTPEEAAQEGIKVAQMIGAKLFTGGAKTFNLNYCAELNTELARIIEQNGIDMLFTHWSEDYHHDHWSLSKAAYHGAKHVKKVLEYHSSFYEGNTQFAPNFYFDISDYYIKKMQLLKEYASEYTRVGDKWEKLIFSTAELNGLKNDCKYAEGFRCVRWLE